MDRASLRSVENKAGMPDYLKTLAPQTAALLVETRAYTAEELQGQVHTVTDSLKRVPFERPFAFTDRVAEYTALWNIRKGLFPAVGAVRETGTTVIIEDVAFPIDRLAKATLHLQDIMRRFRYDEAIIFGHALEGNLHFCFTQDFGPPEEVERYRGFMHEVCDMVVNAYDGSLKAEHGTGRNMAPYVELEWGREAYAVMQRIKEIFDPKNLLNPGVIINANPRAHIENLKPLPRANPIVDKCIECGFCEVNCPSKNLTLTPRQRIVVQREIARLRATCENPARLAELEARLPLPGRGDLRRRRVVRGGLPGGHQHRRAHQGVAQPNRRPRGPRGGRLCRGAFQPDRRRGAGGPQDRGCRPRLLGSTLMESLAAGARRLSGNRIPHWTRWMPRGIDGPRPPSAKRAGAQAVYFPSCISRTMGPAQGDPDRDPLHAVTLRLLEKAGYDVLFPAKMEALCCGTPFESKGFIAQADAKARELEAALLEATDGGRLPVLVDTSPCLYRMKKVMDQRLTLLDPVEFTLTHLMERLQLTPVNETIAYHHTCSSSKMGLEAKALTLARACAAEVVVPDHVGCCGFAGDRGFNYPELNASALQHLRAGVAGKCTRGLFHQPHLRDRPVGPQRDPLQVDSVSCRPVYAAEKGFVIRFSGWREKQFESVKGRVVRPVHGPIGLSMINGRNHVNACLTDLEHELIDTFF